MLKINYDAIEKKTTWKGELLHIAITAVAMVGLAFFVYLLNIPNPNIILIAGQVIFTSIFGYFSGIVSGAAMVIYSMFFFSADHSFINFTQINLQKVIVTVIGAVIIVIFIGTLKHRNIVIRNQLIRANELLKADNINLEKASFTDALTKIGNRGALRRDFHLYTGVDLCVMMFDIDDFKKINDNSGHAAGDAVLKATGKILTDAFGERHCYRYGGDEFLVIVTERSETEFESDLDGMTAASERIKEITGIDVNFSAGYVTGFSERMDDLRSMIREADDLLYTAKKSGKNRFIGDKYNRE